MKKISLFIIGIFCLGLIFSCENLFNGSKDNDGEPVKKSEYTVTLDTNGGTPLEPMVIKAGAKCYVPYATIKSGHNFTGWYYNGRLWDFKNDTVNEDITLIAGWEIINYNITYDLRGGSYDGEMPESYNVNSSDIPLGTPLTYIPCSNCIRKINQQIALCKIWFKHLSKIIPCYFTYNKVRNYTP